MVDSLKGRKAGNVAGAEEEGGGAQKLASFLLTRAPAEDVSCYEPGELEKAARRAWAALSRHRRGESVVDIDNGGEVRRQGRPVTVITVVNDNMPFLFDSILSEISESAGEASLVMHPVFAVRHDGTGVAELLGEPGAARSDAAVDRVSLIHVHVSPLNDREAEGLAERLGRILVQVRAAVADWRPMLARLDQAITQFRYSPVPLDKDDVAEAIAFLEWLRDDNFTFLGMREFVYTGGEKSGTLERSDKRGLGILADPDVLVLRRGSEAVSTTPEIRAFLHGPDPLIVTKANAKSVVHRRVYMDYVGVKTYDADGKLAGELRIVGLFTSTAYTRSARKIPFLRHKVAARHRAVRLRSQRAIPARRWPTCSNLSARRAVPDRRRHAARMAARILDLERPAARARAGAPRPVRPLRLGRSSSCRATATIRSCARRSATYLKTAFDGRLSAFYPAFPEGSLARVHFIIGRSGGKTPVIRCRRTRGRHRRHHPHLGRPPARGDLRRPGARRRHGAAPVWRAFSAGYRETVSRPPRRSTTSPHRAARRRNGRSRSTSIAPRARPTGQPVALKIYRFGEPIPLSRRVPVLENLGFRVIDERTYDIAPPRFASDRATVVLHDMDAGDARRRGRSISTRSTARWRRPSSPSGAATPRTTASTAWSCWPAPDWREVRVLRAYARYLRQAGIRSRSSAGLHRRHAEPHPGIAARDLIELFHARFDPRAAAETRSQCEAEIAAEIEEALKAVPSLDEDRILRRFLNLIEATLRTNFYQRDADGRRRDRRSPSSSIPARSSTACRSRGPIARSSSTVRASRACTCASARSRAAGCAGPTAPRTSAPRCSAWSRRSRSRTPSSCRSAPRAASIPRSCPPAAAATRP